LQATSSTLEFALTGRLLKAPWAAEQNYREFDLRLSDSLYSDRTRVCLQQDAVEDYELDKDAVKIQSMNSTVPQLWTVSAGAELAVKALPETTNSTFISIKVPSKGRYKLTLLNAN
jgi:hypothetical protein